jgi:hypothetical protein
MAMRADIKAAIESDLDVEAAKSKSERGCGTSVAYHFDGPGRTFAGYTVTTTFEGGFTKTFPRVNATVIPDSHDTHLEYAEKPLEELREKRRKLPPKEDPKTLEPR